MERQQQQQDTSDESDLFILFRLLSELSSSSESSYYESSDSDSSDEPKKMYYDENVLKQQQDSSDEPQKIYAYEDSKDEEKNTYEDEDSTKPNQLWEEVEDVIGRDDVERLEWLFLTFHFNLHAERLFDNKSPLTFASWRHTHSVEKLLEWAADVNREDGRGDQPIHKAAWDGSIDCLDLLIFHVDRSKRDYQRKLIPTTNAWKERGEPTKYLVPYNHFRGDINVRTRDGKTALHEAARFNKIDAMHYLLNLGADVNAKDSGKRTPLHMALHKALHFIHYPQYQQHQQRIFQQQTIFHLWFEGADVNARNDENQTPLDVAREALRKYNNDKWKHVAMFEFLIDKKKHESLHRYVALRNEITDKSLSKLSRHEKEIQIARTIDEISKLKLTDLFRLHDYLLKYYTTYFLNKLKQDTDDLVFHSRFSENKEYVDEWFEDEEF